MERSRDYKTNYYLIMLLVIGGIVLIMDIVSYVTMDQRIWYSELIFLIIILLSAQLVYLDARKIEAGKAYPHQRTFRALTWTPVSWGILVLFIWIILFPYYLHKREDIFWQNISVRYDTLKTIEREIKIIQQKQPEPDKSKYSENVRFCPHCNSPYPISMLEHSKYCGVCGGLLKKG